jgi:hypothetical protein
MYRIDSKEVSAALRLSVHPLLRTAGGFTKLKARDAWRFDEHTTSVVNFASFSPYLAASVGCTTFSFSVQLGVFLRLGALQPSGAPEAFLPKEEECPIRIQLGKSLHQAEASDPSLFFVAADGSNLDEVIEDARKALDQNALPCLGRFQDLAYTYRFLLHGDPALPKELTHGGIAVSNPARFSAPLCSAIVALGHVLGVEDPQADLEASPAFVFLRQRRRGDRGA